VLLLLLWLLLWLLLLLLLLLYGPSRSLLPTCTAWPA
jgi:hypothetical protein